MATRPNSTCLMHFNAILTKNLEDFVCSNGINVLMLLHILFHSGKAMTCDTSRRVSAFCTTISRKTGAMNQKKTSDGPFNGCLR